MIIERLTYEYWSDEHEANVTLDVSLNGEDVCVVLRNLRNLVKQEEADPLKNPPPPVDLSAFPLKDSAGIIRTTYNGHGEWLHEYNSVIAKTIDLRQFVKHNEDVFARVKAKAAENENPRPLARVQKVEERVMEMLK